MRIAIALAAALLVGGCSLASLVKKSTVDYTQTYEEMAGVSLVTNVLRARDYAPLNFSALSDIRLQMTLGGSLATSWPTGPLDKSTTRGSIGTGMSGINASTSPSFDVAPLDTQDFTRGILTPIDPVLVKYYMDREIPQKMLMFLLFSQIKTADVASGPPEPDAASGGPRRPGTYFNDPTQPKLLEQFAEYIDEIFDNQTDLNVVKANRYTRLTPIGPPISFSSKSDVLKDLSALDPAKFRLASLPDKKAQLYSVNAEPEIVFCRGNVPLPMVGLDDDIRSNKIQFPMLAPQLPGPRPSASRPSNSAKAHGAAVSSAPSFEAMIRDSWKSVCNAAVAPMTAGGQTNPADFGAIGIRSVEGIIQYLGALLRNPEAAQIVKQHMHYSLIDLSPESDHARYSVDYLDATYFVHPVTSDDRTLQVLALLTQLININKVAKEIPTTQQVEVVP